MSLPHSPVGAIGRRFALRRAVAPLTLALGLSLGAIGASAEPGRGTWAFEPPLSAPRAEVAAVVLLGTLHAIGGSLNNVAGTAHDAYDPATKAWRTLAGLPQPRD